MALFSLLEHGSKTTIQWFYKKTPALVENSKRA